MGSNARGIAALALLLLTTASAAAAQSSSLGGLGGFGLGWGTAGMYANGRSDMKPGQSVFARGGLARGGRPLLAGSAEYQLYQASFPGRRAEFKAISLLAELYLFASDEFYVAPAAGWQFRTWAGDQRVTDSEGGLLGALALGYYLRLGRSFGLSPELAARFGAARDAGAGSFRALGFRVGASWTF
jgi:hypothetical protein